MRENICDLPEDMNEPCRTHGSVACHAGPNFAPSPGSTRHLLIRDSVRVSISHLDHAWATIPAECRGGVPSASTRPSRPVAGRVGSLITGPNIAVAVCYSALIAAVILLLAAWFEVI